MPGRPTPIVLDHHSPGLQLLQRIRDEAHRFALGFHRQRRETRAFESIFDELPGVGPARRRALLRHFGSAEAVLAASQEELEGVPGPAGEDGRAIYAQLHKAGRGSARSARGAAAGVAGLLAGLRRRLGPSCATDGAAPTTVVHAVSDRRRRRCRASASSTPPAADVDDERLLGADPAGLAGTSVAGSSSPARAARCGVDGSMAVGTDVKNGSSRPHWSRRAARDDPDGLEVARRLCADG